MRRSMHHHPDRHALSRRLPFGVGRPLAIWLVLGVLPIFAKMLGLQYLPSPEWVARSSAAAAVDGSVSAVLFLWAVRRGMAILDRSYGPLRRWAAILFAPMVGFMVGSSTITTGAPMIGAILAGDEVPVTFTVSQVKRSADMKCRNPIKLAGLPMFFDELCGYPADFARNARPGERITVAGRGTGLGVFAGRARALDGR